MPTQVLTPVYSTVVVESSHHSYQQSKRAKSTQDSDPNSSDPRKIHSTQLQIRGGQPNSDWCTSTPLKSNQMAWIVCPFPIWHSRYLGMAIQSTRISTIDTTQMEQQTPVSTMESSSNVGHLAIVIATPARAAYIILWSGHSTRQNRNADSGSRPVSPHARLSTSQKPIKIHTGSFPDPLHTKWQNWETEQTWVGLA